QEDELGRFITEDHAATRVEAFRFRSACGRAIDDGLWPNHIEERLQHEALTQLHPEGRELNANHVAETVDHEPWQLVAFGVNQSVASRLRTGEVVRTSPGVSVPDAIVEKP